MPAANTVHVDRLLTAIVVAYKQDRKEFIADQVFPMLDAEKESDKYGKYDIATFFRRPSARGILRAPGAPYPKADFKLASDDFKCEEYGLEFALDDRTRKNADAAYDVENVPVEMLTLNVLREREIRVKDTVTDTTKLTQNVTLAGANQWNDPASVPVTNIETASQTILEATGMLPNLAVIPWQVWRFLKHHAQLLERIKYKDRTSPTVGPDGFFDIFAESFAPDAKLLVPKAIYDTSKEGQASSLAFIWPKDVVIAYVDPSPVKEKPTLGYTFENETIAALRYRKEDITSDMTRVREIVGEKLVEPKCGYLIKAAVA